MAGVSLKGLQCFVQNMLANIMNECVDCGVSLGMSSARRCKDCGIVLCSNCSIDHSCTEELPRELLHMQTALMWSERSKCKRNKVGCVITTEDMRQILAFGYNGPARGLAKNSCTDKEGGCGCLHAEDNAVIYVDATIPNKKAFVTVSPCKMCAQRLVNCNVAEVFYHEKYRDESGLEILKKCGISVHQI